ncbi:MAG: YceI family protein [Pseudomonadota bacterium]
MTRFFLAAASGVALIASASAQDALTDAPAGAYAIDPYHGYIAFSYEHQGYSNPILRFTKFDSEITLDPENIAGSSVTTTMKVEDIDSGVDVFDGHLKSGDWFDAEKFPTISFESTGIDITGENTADIAGDLTVKGVTKPVVLAATFNKLGETRDGTPKLGFSATTKIMRSEFGLGNYVPYVGDEVTITIETEYEQKK